MDLRKQIATLWRWAWLVGIVTAASFAVAFVYSNGQQKTYDAQATLIVGQSLTATSLDYNALLASQRLSQTYATVATKRPILEAVSAEESGSVSVDYLQDHVFAVAPRDSTLVTITVSDTSPDRAARLANEVANQLIAESPAIQGTQQDIQTFVDQQLAATQADITSTQSQIEQLSANATATADQAQQLQALQNRLATLRTAYSTLLGYSSKAAANSLALIEPAVPPSSPSSPRVLVNAVLAAGAAFVIVLALVFIRERFDETIKTASDIEEVAGAAAFGFIPSMASRGSQRCLPTVDSPRAAASEAFRSLRTNLEFARLDAPLHTVLVTSAMSGEGKTTIAANLAVAFAQAGRRALIVDADLRRPGVHRIFQLPNAEGLTSLVKAGAVDLRALQATGVVGLAALPSGPIPPNPADVLSSKRFQSLLRDLATRADVVVIDGPPLSGLADAAILSTMVDGTLVVVRSGKTRRAMLRHAFETLARVDAAVLGVVVNRAKEPLSAYYYAYSANAAADDKETRRTQVEA